MIQNTLITKILIIAVWCAEIHANPPSINLDDYDQQLLNREYINQQIINQDSYNQQLNRENFNPQLGNRNIYLQQLINRDNLNQQLRNQDEINPQLLNQENSYRQFLNRYNSNPQLINRDNINQQLYNRDNINPLLIYAYKFQPEFYVPQKLRNQNERNQQYREELTKYEDNYNRYENPNEYERRGNPNRYNHRINLDYLYYALGSDEHRGNHGGRVIVVPKRNNIPITYTSYEMLLEYLRIRNLANSNQYLRKNRANLGFGLRDFEVSNKEKQGLWPYKVYEEILE